MLYRVTNPKNPVSVPNLDKPEPNAVIDQIINDLMQRVKVANTDPTAELLIQEFPAPILGPKLV